MISIFFAYTLFATFLAKLITEDISEENMSEESAIDPVVQKKIEFLFCYLSVVILPAILFSAIIDTIRDPTDFIDEVKSSWLELCDYVYVKTHPHYTRPVNRPTPGPYKRKRVDWSKYGF